MYTDPGETLLNMRLQTRCKKCDHTSFINAVNVAPDIECLSNMLKKMLQMVGPEGECPNPKCKAKIPTLGEWQTTFTYFEE